MSLTFLQLTNRVLKAFNEVNLTSSNFGTADGFYQEAKDCVNQAIFDIHTEEDARWPFAWNETTLPTVVGQKTAYTLHANATVVDWDTFSIDSDVGADITHDELPVLAYKVYNRTYRINDEEATTESYTKPEQVVRKPDNTVLFTPVPDLIYTVRYEYFTIPASLTAYGDVTVIPDAFEQVIVDKALHYGYMFRDNIEQAALAQNRYADNVNKMRRILIPQFQNIVPR